MSGLAGRLVAAVLAGLAFLPDTVPARPFETGLHLSFNLPMGGFEGETPPDIRFGNAGSGFGGGIELTRTLKGRTGWTTGIGLLFNSLEKGRDLPPTGSEMGSWVNIPLLTGFRFTKGEGGQRGYLQLQGGLNFGSQTQTTYGNMRFETGWATSFAFGCGAGFMIRKFHLGIRYYNIAEADHTLTLSNGTDGSESDLDKVAPSVLQLLAGFSFGS